MVSRLTKILDFVLFRRALRREVEWQQDRLQRLGRQLAEKRQLAWDLDVANLDLQLDLEAEREQFNLFGGKEKLALQRQIDRLLASEAEAHRRYYELLGRATKLR